MDVGGLTTSAAAASGASLTVRGRTATVLPMPLRGAAGRSVSPRGMERDGDLFKFMSETAKGMESLQANGVFHGDSKVSRYLPILIDILLGHERAR